MIIQYKTLLIVHGKCICLFLRVSDYQYPMGKRDSVSWRVHIVTCIQMFLVNAQKGILLFCKCYLRKSWSRRVEENSFAVN